MHLLEARLCLDCEELHTEDRCPMCASDTFAFVTRWIPTNERRIRVRRPPPARSHRTPWLTGGATGLAVFAAMRWLWREPPPAATKDASTEPDPTSDSR
jgi:hypothetical protein